MEALRGPAADQFHILKAAGLRPVDPAQAGGRSVGLARILP